MNKIASCNRTQKSGMSSSVTNHDENLKTKSSPRPCSEEQMARHSNSTNQTRKEHKTFINQLHTHARTHAESRPQPTANS